MGIEQNPFRTDRVKGTQISKNPTPFSSAKDLAQDYATSISVCRGQSGHRNNRQRLSIHPLKTEQSRLAESHLAWQHVTLSASGE